MRSALITFLLGCFALILLAGCESPDADTESADEAALMDKYTSFRLTADLSQLEEHERQMIPLLIEAAKPMDNIFWEQAYGNRDSLLNAIDDPQLRRFAEINYGPWDRLNDNQPFIEGVGPKPAGANYYPADMTKEEFNAAAEDNPALTSLYTMVRRDGDGNLRAIPYREYFAAEMEQSAERLREAAELAEDPGLQEYLNLRADALVTGEYQTSDLAWMDMKTNTLDVVIGPIETYEDQLFGYKAAAETFVLIKDQAWSDRLARYAELLPMLQRGLPVPDAYKQESPGRDADLGAYDVVYVSGDANAGAKTIAINLPNDEEVQLEKGTRRLQLKNAMRAKFEKILAPISNVLMAEDQREHITFDAFFSNTMFHEVAHGLGIKNTITDQGTVREALKEHYTTMEEGKADVLGLYMVNTLQEEGEIDVELMDNYVTFMASIFRSIRFGSASAHGRANLIRFNYFQEQGAFARNDETGTYRINADQLEQAMNDLSEKILRLQGDGDYEATAQFVEQYGQMGDQLQQDLDRLSEEGIPVDITFEQGTSVLEGGQQTAAAQ
jgi:hypothetical protein